MKSYLFYSHRKLKIMKILFAFGTRPEIIKLAPIIKECKKRKIEHVIVHTGQHYDHLMSRVFFRNLELSGEDINLKVGSGTHAETTEKILSRIEKIITKENPHYVIVQGDTNSAMATSLVTVKLHYPLVHVEAGLRSWDRRMPEEYNRIIIDHISDILFPPTQHAKENLLREGIGINKILYHHGIKRQYIRVTGNTIVDVIYSIKRKAFKKSCILNKLNLVKGEYFLLTLHREENVDNRERLIKILKGIELVLRKYEIPIVFPIHPRTHLRIKSFNLNKYVSKMKNLRIISPVDFLDMITLEGNARLILTDSGGLQEEACILKIPSVVLRDRTDRPEIIEVGASVLAGSNPSKIVKSVKYMINKKIIWKNPLGDGKASKKIVRFLKSLHFLKER